MTRAILRTLRAGMHFKCAYQEVWRHESAHNSHHDIFFATRVRDGFESCFAGGAEFQIATRAEIQRALERRNTTQPA